MALYFRQTAQALYEDFFPSNLPKQFLKPMVPWDS